MSQKTDFDVIVVGAGFAGLYMVHKMRKAGRSVRAFEVGDGVGGTWYWNRYPGARCDIDSMEYSFGFDEELEQEWEWTERYSTQPEILSYLEHVADRFELRRDIQFETRVLSAEFRDATTSSHPGKWVVKTDDGCEWSARALVSAVGCLSAANTPNFEGLDDFAGDLYHTARWPHEGVDFSGRRVAVIGTGSSAIQSIPLIAQQAEHLTVFQRTPNYSIPAWNAPLDPSVQREIKSRYRELRAANREVFGAFGGLGNEEGIELPEAAALTPEQQQFVLEEFWKVGGLVFIGAFADITRNPEANEIASEFVRSKIREIVNDPATADLLCPKTHAIACKRPCVDTGYFETFNRAHVDLIDLSEKGIERITRDSVMGGGREVSVDALVLATGFDAMTGSLNAIEILGRGGQTLRDKWSAGPVTYLGLGSAGFPNLFIITGPGSPSVLTNMVVSIEQHVEFISDCLDYMDQQGHRLIEPTVEAESDWVAHVNEVASEYVYPTCNSWYLGANVPGKARVFMPHPGFPPYREKCEEVVQKGYEGFTFDGI